MSQPTEWTDLVFVTFVADAATPPEFGVYVGKTVGLRAAAVPAPGTTGELMGIPGALRSGAGGLEWVMTPAIPVPVDQIPVLAQQIFAQLTEIRSMLGQLLSRLGGG